MLVLLVADQCVLCTTPYYNWLVSNYSIVIRAIAGIWQEYKIKRCVARWISDSLASDLPHLSYQIPYWNSQTTDVQFTFCILILIDTDLFQSWLWMTHKHCHSSSQLQIPLFKPSSSLAGRILNMTFNQPNLHDKLVGLEKDEPATSKECRPTQRPECYLSLNTNR